MRTPRRVCELFVWASDFGPPASGRTQEFRTLKSEVRGLKSIFSKTRSDRGALILPTPLAAGHRNDAGRRPYGPLVCVAVGVSVAVAVCVPVGVGVCARVAAIVGVVVGVSVVVGVKVTHCPVTPEHIALNTGTPVRQELPLGGPQNGPA